MLVDLLNSVLALCALEHGVAHAVLELRSRCHQYILMFRRLLLRLGFQFPAPLTLGNGVAQSVLTGRGYPFVGVLGIAVLHILIALVFLQIAVLFVDLRVRPVL